MSNDRFTKSCVYKNKKKSQGKAKQRKGKLVRQQDCET